MAAFEESLTKLEAVVARLETGELSLEQSVELYEQGMRLSDECKAELDRADGRVRVLMETRSGKMEPAELVLDEDADEV